MTRDQKAVTTLTRAGVLAVLLMITLGLGIASAQRGRSGTVPSGAVTDGEIVRQGSLVATGEHVQIFQHGLKVDAGFLKVAEDAYAKLEALSGRTLDTATLGPKIRIYVSEAISVSHVWKGYEHPKDPKGIVFLSSRAYAGALDGSNATYAHEMTHLFTWRYYSHTLREGLADYFALEIHPGAGVGPNPDGYGGSIHVYPQITECLGTTRPAPPLVISDANFRRAYYYASYRFVKYLIDTAGLDVFMKLYESENPEAELPKLYGASRDELVRRAGM